MWSHMMKQFFHLLYAHSHPFLISMYLFNLWGIAKEELSGGKDGATALSWLCC